jgi:exodeoxyribonuclease VII large subunit
VADVDLVIVARGGGSLEDLWAFNEEAVVRAIVASRIPIVSAVGHEVDTTLADLAADKRAATPTHAAQQVVMDRDEIRQTLAGLSKHARERLRRELEREWQRLRAARNHRALREPHRLVEEAAQRVDQAREQLSRALQGIAIAQGRRLDHLSGKIWAHTPDRTIQRARDRVLSLAHRAERGAAETVARKRADVETRRRLLESFDYKGVLRRGYALVWTEKAETRDRLVNRAGALRSGAAIQVQFADGAAKAQVTGVTPAREEETA